MGDVRIALIRDWLAGELGWPEDLRLERASADASFRRYFRVWRPSGATAVVMDAPPDKENIAPYLHVGSLLRSCGVHVPEVEAADAARGFLLLEDLGSTHMLARLGVGADPDVLVRRGARGSGLIQLHGGAAMRVTCRPTEREALEREMRLLPDLVL